MSRSLKAHLLLVAITVLWGATFVLIKDALADISPLLFNAVRMSVAGLMLVMFFHRHLSCITPAALKAGILIGVFLFLGYVFQTTGLRLTTPSKSAFITGLSVVLVPVFLCLFWRKAVKRWTVVGVGTAFAGLYLLSVPLTVSKAVMLASPGDRLVLASVNRGDLLTLGCAVAFAFQIILVGRSTERYRYQQIAAVQIITCALLHWAAIPLLEHPFVQWSPIVIWAILITAFGCTAIAFAIQAWAQQFTPPTHTALIFSLEPVAAWATSYLLLGERLGIRATIGAGLILAGVLISELKGAAGKSSDEHIDVVGV